MDQKRNKFPHDQDNRIQKLYYDVNIHTISNRTKLQNVKKKFWKYLKYLQKKYNNDVQPKLIELQKIRDGLYIQLQQANKFSFIHNPTSEHEEKRKALVPIFREADENYEEMKYEEHFYDEVIGDIQDKIDEFKTQQKALKHYKNCAQCEKLDKVTNCGCKSNHKLCYDCIYDKTECPVCNEDLNLVHCDICMEYKKELVDTGCKNKHQTCKDCLDKIQKNKRRRALDNNIRNGYHRDTEPYYFKYKCPFCRGSCNIECGRDEYYHNYDDNDYGYDDYGSDEEFWRRDEENEDLDRDARRDREEEDRRDYMEEEDRRDYMEEEDRREDRRESMRERARERRARM
jgi:hypothetical protein